MDIHNATDAARVLSAAHHRGIWRWEFDELTMRVQPAAWNGTGEQPPRFTPFEAVTLARGLQAIGAGSRQVAGPTVEAGAELRTEPASVRRQRIAENWKPTPEDVDAFIRHLASQAG